MSAPPSTADSRFEDVAWDDLGGGGPLVGRRTLAFLGSLVALVGLFVRDYRFGDSTTLPGWEFTRLDWLFVLSMLLVAFYVVWPLARDRERTRRYWRRFRQDRLAVAALAYLGVFFVLATVGHLFLPDQGLNLPHKFQPPVFFSIEESRLTECAGEVVGEACHGSWRYPLGTNSNGEGMFLLAVEGMRVGLKIGLTTTVIAIPIAVAVGTAAGFLGGLADDVLMRYVEVQQTVPALLVYIVIIFVAGKSLFMLVLVFGLFNWGGVARLVRDEVVQRREAAYVTAARGAGAGRLAVVRRHVLPNVSTTVITATMRMIPMLILVQAALAYLDLNDIDLRSFGEVIAFGLNGYWMGPLQKWWVSTVAVVFLGLTVLSFNVVGDALGDALDPRGEGA